MLSDCALDVDHVHVVCHPLCLVQNYQLIGQPSKRGLSLGSQVGRCVAINRNPYPKHIGWMSLCVCERSKFSVESKGDLSSFLPMNTQNPDICWKMSQWVATSAASSS